MTSFQMNLTSDPFGAARAFAAQLRAAALETDHVTHPVLARYWTAMRAQTFTDLDRLDALVTTLPDTPLNTDQDGWRQALGHIVAFYQETFAWTAGHPTRTEAITEVPRDLTACLDAWRADARVHHAMVPA
ncbi:hypothetical protein [Deinococcus soli (ex Cha et al. 2016)]|uniref:Uncharacterized protein n=2 Tax=Deinococcus soli (ex Cha et al. 2016) TaxID=1309411 RepID=A0ACC6KHP7_9DEIO|nr:hypothetical protein [Deinococcus soli (ex Cha et al. 2016)]MDR6218784.1 hypothetical protein [Deinococcus soli (ex Cha et al. 2016)]MDR6328581.1 hypothetical protein [Deinococcus soli (ex Cha et al. 2016)]MDR6751932.1 hypothetical protein [Deinococcus soli (ex Cha et al. 2016)]